MEVKFLGSTSREDLERNAQIVAAAGKLSRFNGNVFEVLEDCNDFEKNVKFIERIIKMGHESITDHNYMVFAIKGVSPVIEQTIIEERMSSFTIKSRREVNFANVGYYIPDFHDKEGNIMPNNNELKEQYCSHMQYLFNSYQKFIDLGISKEDSRFVLPYSYHSEIIMGLDAHCIKNMIIEFTKGVKSNISEIREFGEMLATIFKEQAPYYTNIIGATPIHNIDKVRQLLDTFVEDTSYKVIDKPAILNHTLDIDATILISAIMYKYQFDDKQAKNIYECYLKNDEQMCKKIMKAIYIEDQKVLSQVSFQLEMPYSLASLTHITRHRTHWPLIPTFVPIHDLTQYKTPNSIASKCPELYHTLFATNLKIYEQFKEQGIRDEDLIYFHLSGNTVNMVTNIDGRSLAWIIRLRTCSKAQWEIKENFDEIRALLKSIAPIYSTILGPDCETKRFCGEGKESCGKIKKLLLEGKAND